MNENEFTAQNLQETAKTADFPHRRILALSNLQIPNWNMYLLPNLLVWLRRGPQAWVKSFDIFITSLFSILLGFSLEYEISDLGKAKLIFSFASHKKIFHPLPDLFTFFC